MTSTKTKTVGHGFVITVTKSTAKTKGHNTYYEIRIEQNGLTNSGLKRFYSGLMSPKMVSVKFVDP